MNKNTDEKSLQVIDNSFFSQIKRFIMKIFGMKKEKQDEDILEIDLDSTKGHERFISSIKIEQDSDYARILNLYNEFRKGKIREEDLSNEDIEKLEKLYLKNIEKVKKSIEYYKYKIKIFNT